MTTSGQPLGTGAGGGRSIKDRITGVKVPGWVLASRPFRWLAPRVLPRTHKLLHHLSGGRWMFDSDAQPMCMLTTTGAKTGQPRETPLAAVPVEDGKLLVVGSNFASDKHPAWTANLLAHPEASVRFKGRSFRVRARLLPDDEREERWDLLVGWFPNWRDYTEVTDRKFRVFELTPIEC
jgi:deazaflavin-dependent oxidoreductase (nitroreductase family)